MTSGRRALTALRLLLVGATTVVAVSALVFGLFATAWGGGVAAALPGFAVGAPLTVGLSAVAGAVGTGTLRPWLDIRTATRTPAADAHLADFIDDVLIEYEITDLHLGFYDEYHAAGELLDWLLTDVRDRADDARLDEPYLLEHHRTAT